MLLRFSVSNFLSICEEQELNLLATTLSEEEGLYILSSPKEEQKVLPLIAIFGANASGKSNFLSALSFMRQLIVSSDEREIGRRGFERPHFRLNPRMEKERSLFSCDFLTDGVRFQYGFEINNNAVLKEWLYAYPKGIRQVWLDRDMSEDPVFHFGRSLKGQNQSLAGRTKAGSLFLSTAARWNHQQLLPIHRFFEDCIHFYYGMTPATHDVLLKDKRRRRQIVDYIRNADTGIQTIFTAEEPLDDRSVRLHRMLVEAFPEDYGDSQEKLDFENDTYVTVKFEHLDSRNNPVLFDLKDESRGTLQLYALLDPILTALEEGLVLVIDEIDTSLHPYLLRKILLMFHDKNINTGGGQLIFTSHDATVLDGQLMRRDEKWFTQKDDAGRTKLYPLIGFSTRQQDDFVRLYLDGRYGGVPILPDRLISSDGAS